MRCSPHAALGAGLALALGMVAALVTADCVPVLCTRNSDCPTGQVCTTGGGCVPAPGPDAGDDAAGSADAAATTDAGSLPTDAAQSGSGGSGGGPFREATPWPP